MATTTVVGAYREESIIGKVIAADPIKEGTSSTSDVTVKEFTLDNIPEGEWIVEIRALTFRSGGDGNSSFMIKHYDASEGTTTTIRWENHLVDTGGYANGTDYNVEMISYAVVEKGDKIQINLRASPTNGGYTYVEQVYVKIVGKPYASITA